VLRFQAAWRESKSNEEIPPGFNFKPLYAAHGKFELRQLDAAGRDYRVAIVFPDGRNEVYFVHAWKKTKQINRGAVERAKSLALTLWDQLQRG
jgi:hypothetical protein